MADLKISQLTSATLPLAGTEVLPIVQSNSTKKVATDDLTVKNVRSSNTTGILQVAGPAAGTTRVMTTPNANFTVARTDAAQSFTGDQTLATDNLVQGTAAKGFNFTANTPRAGMTSQLLNWYEEGKYDIVITCGTSGTVTLEPTQNTAFYTRIGRVVNVQGSVRVASVSSPTGFFTITLPFTIATAGATTVSFSAPVGVSYSVSSTVGAFIGIGINAATTLRVFLNTGNQLTATSANQLQAASDIWFSFSYVAA